MSTTLTDVAGTVASLSMLSTVIQAVRIFREGSTGVSVSTWALRAYSAGLWITYGVVLAVPGEIVGNIFFVLGAGAIILGCARSGTPIVRTSLLATGALGVTLVPCLIDTRLLGPVAVVTGVAAFFPQAFIRSHNLKGVSVVAWLWTIVSSIAWMLYGVGLHQVAVWCPNVITIPVSVVIIARALLSHRRDMAPATEPVTST